jgi:hypothetical protein
MNTPGSCCDSSFVTLTLDRTSRSSHFISLEIITGTHRIGEHVVAGSVANKPEDRAFDSRWGHRILSIYIILPAALVPGVHSTFNRNEYLKHNKNVSGEYNAAVD